MPRPLHKTPQYITEILDDLLLLVSQEPEGSKISIEKGYMPDLPQVDLDPAQTREALWNLLINAAEAMPDGGDLRVSVGRSEKNDDFIEVVVKDSGTGISKSEQEKIFEPFHTTKADGTGLGLAIVNRVVEAHAGETEVESEVGQGSSFRLRFPVTSNERK